MVRVRWCVCVCVRGSRERTLSSSSFMNLESSLVVSLIRSRSLRSTTQMMASIPCAREDEEKAAVTLTLPISGASYLCAVCCVCVCVWRQDMAIARERLT